MSRPDARLALGAEAAAGHLPFDLAFGLDVLVDLTPDLVRFWRVQVNLLLEDVAQSPTRHAHVIEVLREDQRVHRRKIVGVVHLLHGVARV